MLPVARPWHLNYRHVADAVNIFSAATSWQTGVWFHIPKSPALGKSRSEMTTLLLIWMR